MLPWVAKAQQQAWPVELIPEPEVNTGPVVSYQVDHCKVSVAWPVSIYRYVPDCNRIPLYMGRVQ
jgi:hypothetical protein